MEQATGFTWKFQRIGGLDQVTLRTADELCHLDELDPKLWVALSCPADGLEFDQRTLEVIDADKDGRIRIPEVIAAASWLCGVLKDPAVIVNPASTLALELINTDTAEGKRLYGTAQAVLETLGKSGAKELGQEDVAAAVAGAAKQTFNGDGILPILPVMREPERPFIQYSMNVVGSVMDPGGPPGGHQEIAAAFIATPQSWPCWKQSECTA